MTTADDLQMPRKTTIPMRCGSCWRQAGRWTQKGSKTYANLEYFERSCRPDYHTGLRSTSAASHLCSGISPSYPEPRCLGGHSRSRRRGDLLVYRRLQPPEALTMILPHPLTWSGGSEIRKLARFQFAVDNP